MRQFLCECQVCKAQNHLRFYAEPYPEYGDKFEAGMVLEGAEVKSLRNKEFNLQDSFISIINEEVFLKNAYIKPYEKATAYAPNPRRNIKLLLNKKALFLH